MGYIGSVTFKGASGNNYDFTALTGDADLGGGGGVYIFTKRSETTDGVLSYTPLYIGQTQSFSDRLPNHEKWACALRNGVDSICILRHADEQTRRNIETDLLRNGTPVCND